jgi:fibronectin type III domain protein
MSGRETDIVGPVVSERASANRIIGLLFLLGLVLAVCAGGILWYAGTRGPETPLPSATASGSASVKLAWNSSPSVKVIGYSILWGTESGRYTNSVEVGNETTGTLSGLKSGTTYYVVVVAVDAQGNRSPPSNELEVVARH